MIEYLHEHDKFYFVNLTPSPQHNGYDHWLNWTEEQNGRPSIEDLLMAKAQGFNTCFLSSMVRTRKNGIPREFLDTIDLS